MQSWHPLLGHHPDEWRNVPICVKDGFKDMISSVVLGNENLFDFQMQQNERLYKTQLQITDIKAN